MATINFYLDKPGKKGAAPIHLRINCNGEQVKVATGEKVEPEYFDKEAQRLSAKAANHAAVNHYLDFLTERAQEMFSGTYKRSYTNKQIKDRLQDLIDGYRADTSVRIVKEQAKPDMWFDFNKGLVKIGGDLRFHEKRHGVSMFCSYLEYNDNPKTAYHKFHPLIEKHECIKNDVDYGWVQNHHDFNMAESLKRGKEYPYKVQRSDLQFVKERYPSLFKSQFL